VIPFTISNRWRTISISYQRLAPQENTTLENLKQPAIAIVLQEIMVLYDEISNDSCAMRRVPLNIVDHTTSDI
jgi:hypothetical protein